MLEDSPPARIRRRGEVDEQSVVDYWRSRSWTSHSLRTTSGHPLEIVFQGRWAPGSGPDFCDAVIAFPAGKLSTGDVEIHVLASDWYRHGHQHDPAYDNVVLHVVNWDDLSVPVLRANGRPVETLELSPNGPVALDSSIHRMPDCHTIAAELPAGKLNAALEQLGDEWFLVKAGRLQSEMSVVGPEAILIGALFDALGYSQNRKPLRRLATGLRPELLQWAVRSGPSTIEGILIGLAGLLPSQRPVVSSDWQTDDYTAELESVWHMASDPASQPILAGSDWRFSVRPGNSPLRRLGAAARLVAPGLDGLIDSWLRAVVAEPFDLPALLSSLIVKDSDSYWAWHSDFARPLPTGPVALIGRSRAVEIAANVVLPFVHALASMAGQPVLASNAMIAFGLLAAPSWNVATRSAIQLVSHPDLAKLASGARRRQGLQWLYRSYCEQGRLLDCPLLELSETHCAGER